MINGQYTEAFIGFTTQAKVSRFKMIRLGHKMFIKVTVAFAYQTEGPVYESGLGRSPS